MLSGKTTKLLYPRCLAIAKRKTIQNDQTTLLFEMRVVCHFPSCQIINLPSSSPRKRKYVLGRK